MLDIDEELQQFNLANRYRMVYYNDLLYENVGKNRALFSGHFLRGSYVENIGPRLRPTSRLVLEEHLEHDGFRRRRHRVNSIQFLVEQGSLFS